ncbi:DUF29 domain-containing protein [Nostoc edaphicum]|uniref:DUF29 domain-containing protein n=1 Tax=Nostoc edaphicum TaxID=264686 RepID=UPI001EEC167D|nr:DUF29 domain-containing protein [Nostoc edaphicum]
MQRTILEHRRRVQKALKESPSLKSHFDQVFDESYQTARRLAVIETGLAIAIFPEKSLFTPEQTLDPDFLPES